LVISTWLDESVKSTLYPQTLGFIQASRSSTEDELYPEAMKSIRDLNIDLASVIGDYVRGPKLYSLSDIMAFFHQTPEFYKLPSDILGAVESEHDKVKRTMTQGRKLFVSEAGHLGLCPEEAEANDVICVLLAQTSRSSYGR
jgi:hypothetical protein